MDSMDFLSILLYFTKIFLNKRFVLTLGVWFAFHPRYWGTIEEVPIKKIFCHVFLIVSSFSKIHLDPRRCNYINNLATNYDCTKNCCGKLNFSAPNTIQNPTLILIKLWNRDHSQNYFNVLILELVGGLFVKNFVRQFNNLMQMFKSSVNAHDLYNLYKVT